MFFHNQAVGKQKDALLKSEAEQHKTGLKIGIVAGLVIWIIVQILSVLQPPRYIVIVALADLLAESVGVLALGMVIVSGFRDQYAFGPKEDGFTYGLAGAIDVLVFASDLFIRGYITPPFPLRL